MAVPQSAALSRLTWVHPPLLDLDPEAPGSADDFELFEALLKPCIQTIEEEAEKLLILRSRLSGRVFSIVKDQTTYVDSLAKLRSTYVPTVNTVYTRNRLATRKQAPDESVEAFARTLDTLARQCTWVPMSAAEYQAEMTRDALVAGLRSGPAREKLLQEENLTMARAVKIAATMEAAKEQAGALVDAGSNADSINRWVIPKMVEDKTPVTAAATHPTARRAPQKCYFCGKDRHTRQECPARTANCTICNKKGHFARVCRSLQQRKPQGAACNPAQVRLTEQNSLT